MTLSSTWPLVLLLTVAFVWHVLRTTSLRHERSRLRFSGLVRSALLALIALALTSPRWGGWTEDLSVVFVLDVSRSVDPSFVESSLTWIDKTAQGLSDDEARFIAFADRAERVDNAAGLRNVSVSSRGPLEGVRLPAHTLDQSRTNLESGLRSAIRSCPPSRVCRVVWITDGGQTEGDVARAVWEAQRRGIRVFTVPAPTRMHDPCWVEGLEAPEEPSAGEPLHVDVRISCREPASGTVELTRNGGQLLGSKEVDLSRGAQTVRFALRLDAEGLVRLGATLNGAPSVDRLVVVGPRPKVLLVEGQGQTAGHLARALEREDLDLQRRSSAQLPERFDDYDAVILSNVASETLREEKMQALADYVEAGGGLVFIAGETSFGEGAYHGSVLEQVLPVRFQVLEKRKEVALLIILDKSYSMTGEKIALAKAATKAALDLLEKHHEFGVVAFDWYPRVVVPLQAAKEKLRIKEAVDNVAASDPTRIYPALEKAEEMLQASSAKVKHVILLSDGKSQRADFETLVRRMKAGGITISTVSVGEEADQELLVRMARWGSGRSYLLEDPRKVPEVFIREAQIATEKTLDEEPFRPVLRWEVEALAGVDLTEAPELLGYVNMKPKETAEVLMETPTSAPVLARWRYGLGKSVVFTSDAGDRWAARWLGWEGYGKFWSQLVRETMRRPAPGDLDFRVERKGPVARITLDAADRKGRLRNGLQPRVEMVHAGSQRFTIPLRQGGPGTYVAELPLAVSPEPYVLRLLEPQSPRGPIERALMLAEPDEDVAAGPDTELLRAVSEATGGRFAANGAEIFADHGDRARRSIALGPWLCGLALLLYLVEIGLRRLPGLQPGWEESKDAVSAKQDAS